MRVSEIITLTGQSNIIRGDAAGYVARQRDSVIDNVVHAVPAEHMFAALREVYECVLIHATRHIGLYLDLVNSENHDVREEMEEKLEVPKEEHVQARLLESIRNGNSEIDEGVLRYLAARCGKIVIQMLKDMRGGLISIAVEMSDLLEEVRLQQRNGEAAAQTALAGA